MPPKDKKSLEAMGFPSVSFGKRIDVVLRFTEDLLGTVPKSKDVYEAYIRSKIPPAAKGINGPTEDELITIEDIEEGGWTGFHQDDTGLFFYNYWIKGFLKSSIEALQEAEIINRIPAYRKWIDRMIFIYPRKVYFMHTVKSPEGYLERPLRAKTPQGERIALTRSDIIKAGAKVAFTIELLKNSKGLDKDVLGIALLYGQYVGMGQWRGSGGYGQFMVDEFAGMTVIPPYTKPVKDPAPKATKAQKKKAA